MKEDFWFYLLVGIILLISGIRVATIYLKSRQKDMLVALIVTAVLFVGNILLYVFPTEEWLHIGPLGAILISVFFIAVLAFSLFYMEIKRLFHNRKK